MDGQADGVILRIRMGKVAWGMGGINDIRFCVQFGAEGISSALISCK